jgi:hypothetical protein
VLTKMQKFPISELTIGLVLGVLIIANFFMFVSSHDFGPMLAANVSVNGYLSFTKLMTVQVNTIVVLSLALIAILALIEGIFFRTAVGQKATKNISLVVSLVVSTSICWIGTRDREFENGTLFRSGRNDDADIISMFVFTAIVSLLAIVLVLLICLISRRVSDNATPNL